MPIWLNLLDLALALTVSGLLLGLTLGLCAPRRSPSCWQTRSVLVLCTWLLGLVSLSACIVSSLVLEEHYRHAQ